mmetsp:Transcript_59688/g.128588  ORF Transcript_59688/g.128588 Transcript_59688/m.128588 type:complete len:83 (+) Transcript_59688:2-250(+)
MIQHPRALVAVFAGQRSVRSSAIDAALSRDCHFDGAFSQARLSRVPSVSRQKDIDVKICTDLAVPLLDDTTTLPGTLSFGSG